jgi:inosose dehydratase
VDRFEVGYSAGDWSPDQFLPAFNDIASLGYAGVEIGNDIVQIFADREDEFLSLVKLVNLRTTSIRAGLLLTEPRYLNVDVEVVRQSLGFLKKVTKDGILVAIPGDFEGERRDGVYRVAWTLSKIAEEAHEAGVRICVKPHRGSALTGMDEIARFLELTESASDRLFLALDTAHLTLSGTDIVDCIRTWPERIGHVYLTDVAKRAPESGSPLTDAGTGTADLPSVVYALRKAGYEGWVIGSVDSPPVAPKQSAEVCAKYFRERLNMALGTPEAKN